MFVLLRGDRFWNYHTVIISPLLTTKHHQLNVNEKPGRKKKNHKLKHKSMIKKGKRINTPLQSYHSLSKLTKCAQKPPAPPTSLTASRNKHTVKLNTTSDWKQGTHQSMYYGKLVKKKQKTSMHLVTISVCLCMSEFTGNTLALCPMQTQLFLKSSCPLISYFNRYRPCQIRER